MTRNIVHILTLFCALNLIVLRAVGADVVAQYTAPNNGNLAGFSGSQPNYIPAQTFTTTGGGELYDVTVSLAANGGPPSFVQVQIRTVGAGFPTATVLGSANILSPALTGAPQDFTANFIGSGINLLPATSYAIALTTDGGAWACGEFIGAYPGGLLTQSFDTGATFTPTFYPHDLQFTVTTVPEPTSATMLLVAALGWTASRTRSRRRPLV